MKQIIIGNRIPKDYFITTGKGESDITIHAGSYHLALKDAGIESQNIITYSSILPAIASEMKNPKEWDHNLIYGAVMECIMAVASTNNTKTIAAGISYGWLYDRKTNEKFGGIVCEHNGEITESQIRFKLNLSLHEIFYNGFSEKYELRDVKTITESFTPNKKYGTVIVALCFTNYVIPIIK